LVPSPAVMLTPEEETVEVRTGGRGGLTPSSYFWNSDLIWFARHDQSAGVVTGLPSMEWKGSGRMYVWFMSSRLQGRRAHDRGLSSPTEEECQLCSLLNKVSAYTQVHAMQATPILLLQRLGRGRNAWSFQRNEGRCSLAAPYRTLLVINKHGWPG
jgi:hypothetical protein